MPLAPGTRVGSYEILASIGAGGMGEVYRAKDAKLKREVALKVLPESFSGDPERMARFQREAEVLASLNHPNIAQIYGAEDRALVMELVAGETLRGPLPLETALSYARQIVDALEAAHEKGITHRDLKPANIMITPAGVVKVLDFGLAKAADDAAASGNPANSPTLTMSPTQAGMIMGTAAYMSPEQARGKPVDKRADIWAFGCVLYEMLTGKQLFQGDTVSDILAAVLKEEPDWNRVPAKVQRLLRGCLQKEPSERLRDIADAKLLLDDAPAPTQSPGRAGWIWPSVAAVFVLTTLSLAFVHFREKPPTAPAPMRFQIPPPEKGRFGAQMSLSPDGRRLAFTANGQDGVSLIWVRSLDSLEARPLAGTQNNGQPPFWSPDSRFIAYGANGKLMKVEASGGPPQALCDAPRSDRWGLESRWCDPVRTEFRRPDASL